MKDDTGIDKTDKEELKISPELFENLAVIS